VCSAGTQPSVFRTRDEGRHLDSETKIRIGVL
jgi:hypothetical protein